MYTRAHHCRRTAYEFRVVPPLPQAGARRWLILTTHAETPLALRQGNGAQDALGNQALRGALARVLPQMIAYTQFDPSLRQARTMAMASSSVVAMGFSTSTCFQPAPQRASAWRAGRLARR